MDVGAGFATGEAVKGSKIPREEIFVTTKVWNSDHGYHNTLSAFDRSLKDLDLGYGVDPVFLLVLSLTQYWSTDSMFKINVEVGFKSGL